MQFEEAHKLAVSVRDKIRPFCMAGHCEVAGSIRRQKPEDIKDVEIVAIPNSLYLRELRDIVNHQWGTPEIGAFPSKYTRVRGAVNIDFFWCTPQTWGLNFFIRTGSAEYVKMALTQWKQKHAEGFAHQARLYTDPKTMVDTPTEAAVFEALGWTWEPPEKRK